jgi:excisionase family DNA binding protein
MAVDRLLQSPAEDFKLLTAAEASELIRLPRSSLHELVRNRRIPFVRIGRRVFRAPRLDPMCQRRDDAPR